MEDEGVVGDRSSCRDTVVHYGRYLNPWDANEVQLAVMEVLEEKVAILILFIFVFTKRGKMKEKIKSRWASKRKPCSSTMTYSDMLLPPPHCYVNLVGLILFILTKMSLTA